MYKYIRPNTFWYIKCVSNLKFHNSKRAPTNVFARMYIYLPQNKFDIANVFQIWHFIFQRGPQQTYLLECIYTFDQIRFDISNVFQIWIFIFQRGSQQTFLLKCINTFDQINLIYRMCFKFENLIFQRGPQQTYFLKCLSNMFWIQNFIFHRGALTMIIAQMYIKCTVFFIKWPYLCYHRHCFLDELMQKIC